jgi:hypothetical protein
MVRMSYLGEVGRMMRVAASALPSQPEAEPAELDSIY